MASISANAPGMVAEIADKFGRLLTAILPALNLPLLILVFEAAFALSIPSNVVGQTANSGYPTDVVQLPAGILLCSRSTEVEQTFENWKEAFEHQLPETLGDGCERNASGNLLARLEFLRPFQNEHLTADMLRFYIFQRKVSGLLVFSGIAYGYGAAKMRRGVLATFPAPIRN